MYTYFEPLLVKPRLVPLNPTEKLLHHSNVYIVSVSSYCSDLKKLHRQSLSKNCLMESFIIQGGSVLETTTKFHLLNSIQALILVHESWCGLAWPFCFGSLHPYHPHHLLPGNHHLHIQLDSPRLPPQTLSWSITNPIKRSGICKRLPWERGQALTTVCSSRGTQLSLFQTQWSTRLHKKIYIFHIPTLSSFSSTVISETEVQVNQAFWKTNLPSQYTHYVITDLLGNFLMMTLNFVKSGS